MVRWFVALGASLVIGGVAWIGVLDYRIRDYAEAVKYEVRMPWAPRLMVFFGLVLLTILGASAAIKSLRQRN
jgi:hypothetical protein